MDISDIKVSVILPIYNVGPYLRECLDSIIEQTLYDIEIICVNDGSTDDSLDILRRYAEIDKRLIIYNQQNAGAGVARNKGLELARGKYISFLDADDFFKNTMLEKAYYQCEADKADIVIFKAYTYTNGTKVICEAPWALRKSMLPKMRPFSCKDMPDYIFNAFQNWTWNKLFKADFIRRNSLCFQSLKRTNDLLFTCSALATADRITVIDEFLVYYRIGMKNNSQATNHIAPLDFYYAFTALKKFLIKRGLYYYLQKSFVNSAIDGCIYNLNSIQSPEAYKQVYLKLKRDSFRELDFEEKTKNYFYNKKNYLELQRIKQLSFEAYRRRNILTSGPIALIIKNTSTFIHVFHEYGLVYAIRRGVQIERNWIRRNMK